jgi:hypothetical protein
MPTCIFGVGPLGLVGPVRGHSSHPPRAGPGSSGSMINTRPGLTMLYRAQKNMSKKSTGYSIARYRTFIGVATQTGLIMPCRPFFPLYMTIFNTYIYTRNYMGWTRGQPTQPRS